MPPIYLPQLVNLEVNDIRIIQEFAEREGLGKRGFSAALRRIIRDWEMNERKIENNRPHNQTGKSQPVKEHQGRGDFQPVNKL
jgi:hypothetical protein